MKKVLVTGCAGFIGHKVSELLLKRGDTVVGIDNLNDYYDVRLKNHRLNLLKSFNNFSFHAIDIESFADLQQLFKTNEFSSVFNLAARAGVRYSMENPWIYLRTNTEGSLNLLECMRSYKVKKYIMASTSSLYAGQNMPFNEDLPVNTPISPYAASKKAAEMLAYTYHLQYGTDISILRYFTVFGPLGRPDMAPYRFVKQIVDGKPISLFGDGTQSRDFTYIDDIAAGTLLAEKELGYEIINLGGGKQPITINSFIGYIEELANKKAIINYLPVHSADMTETWANIDKATNILGWKPVTSVYEGLQEIFKQKESLCYNL